MDPDEKALAFAALVVLTYGVHQATVGGDGVLFASVVAALCSIGGYVIGRPGRS